MTLPTVMVCLKQVDVRGGASGESGDGVDQRFAGVSLADQAALEIGLRIAAARGAELVAVTAGPTAAERALREAYACGATRLVRVAAAIDAPSRTVAAALAVAARQFGAGLVVCGDYSLDRGSASVPGFLAAELGVAQALGLVGVDVGDAADTADAANGVTPAILRVTRRLDGGRREVVELSDRAVMSVEGSVATLRRAGLPRTLAAKSQTVEVLDGAQPHQSGGPIESERIPFRPRSRVLPPPVGTSALERLRQLTDAGAAAGSGRAEPVVLAPSEAAARIVESLQEWGYLS